MLILNLSINEGLLTKIFSNNETKWGFFFNLVLLLRSHTSSIGVFKKSSTAVITSSYKLFRLRFTLSIEAAEYTDHISAEEWKDNPMSVQDMN